MPELVAVVFLALAAMAWVVRVYSGLLAQERARVSELYSLLEAKAAPPEFAAYVHAPDPEPDNRRWITSEDGLISYPVED